MTNIDALKAWYPELIERPAPRRDDMPPVVHQTHREFTKRAAIEGLYLLSLGIEAGSLPVMADNYEDLAWSPEWIRSQAEASESRFTRSARLQPLLMRLAARLEEMPLSTAEVSELFFFQLYHLLVQMRSILRDPLVHETLTLLGDESVVVWRYREGAVGRARGETFEVNPTQFRQSLIMVAFGVGDVSDSLPPDLALDLLERLEDVHDLMVLGRAIEKIGISDYPLHGFLTHDFTEDIPLGLQLLDSAAWRELALWSMFDNKQAKVVRNLVDIRKELADSGWKEEVLTVNPRQRVREADW
jgi:hypothetical protein